MLGAALVASIGNNTTTPLNDGQTFTGTWEHNNYPDVQVSCITDTSGTLYFDFSPDGSNVNTFPTNGFLIGAGLHAFHTAVKGGRQFRVRFVNNSGSNQTYLRLYIYYGTFRSPNAPLNQTLGRDNDAVMTRNPYDPMEIALGRITGIDSSESPKFGYNGSLTSAAEETIWAPSTRWTRGATNSTVTVVSDSTSDTSAGTGARTVVIAGVNSSTGSRDTETITMNGTTPVVSTKTWKLGGVNRAYVATAGTGGVNAGNITITHTGAASTQAYIPANHGITQQMIYTVADDEYVLLSKIRINAAQIGGGASPVIRFKAYRYMTSGVKHEFFDESLDTAVNNYIDYGDSFYMKFAGVDQFEMTATSDTSSSFVGATAFFANVRI